MRVAAQHAPFAAHDQQHLGVGLVVDDAIHDLHAGLLQAVGQADVRLLVEAGAQLDDRRHLLAGAGRLGQVADQRRVLADPVQRLPDRQYVGVRAGLAQQFEHGRERFEWVVQQQVALADGVEHAGVSREGARHGRHERRIFQVRTIDHVIDRRRAMQVDRSAAQVHVGIGQAEVHQQHLPHLGRAALAEFQPHRVGVSPLAQFHAQHARQVLGVAFFQLQFGIARHAELAGAADRHAGKHDVGEALQQGGEEHELMWRVGDLRRQADHARQRARRAHDRDMALATEGVLAVQHHRDIEALVEYPRERVGRIQAQRREHRQDLALEVRARPARLCGRPGRAVDEHDALARQRRAQLVVPRFVLGVHQPGGVVAHLREHLGQGHAVRARARVAVGDPVPEAGHAHLEELVEVAHRDAQEVQPLQQRYRGVACLGQHPGIEFERRKFMVEVQVRCAEIDAGRLRLDVLRRACDGHGRGGG